MNKLLVLSASLILFASCQSKKVVVQDRPATNGGITRDPIVVDSYTKAQGEELIENFRRVKRGDIEKIAFNVQKMTALAAQYNIQNMTFYLGAFTGGAKKYGNRDVKRLPVLLFQVPGKTLTDDDYFYDVSSLCPPLNNCD